MPLCLHTMTTKPWSLEDCARHYPTAGIDAITVWRQHLQGHNPTQAGNLLRNAGLSITSLCRGGFFPAPTSAERQSAIDDNLLAIEQAHQLGAPLIVLVCGAHPSIPLNDARQQTADGIATILPTAQQANIKLAIEPLHPMYAGDRSAINTLAQANQLIDQLQSPTHLGIAIDVYHVWWDDTLQTQIQLTAQKNRLYAYHICDWKTPTTDLLNDRGLMGEGCIPLQQIKTWIQQTGFTGPDEVEIFSNHYWSIDQQQYLKKITQAYHQTHQTNLP